MTTPPDPQQLYDLASSFPEFVRQTGEYHGLDVPDIHLDIARALETGHDFVGITGFRGAGKSYVTELYACWRYFLQPQLQVIAACGEALRSRQFSVSVATFLHETPWLRHLAPGVDLSRVGEKWNLSGIKVGDWPSLTSRTTRGNFRGPRAHLIILDDPIPSQYKDALGFRATLHESLQDVPRILHPVERYWKALGLKAPAWARTRCVGLWTPTGPAPSNWYGKSSEKDNIWNRFSENAQRGVPAEQGWRLGGYSYRWLLEGNNLLLFGDPTVLPVFVNLRYPLVEQFRPVEHRGEFLGGHALVRGHRHLRLTDRREVNRVSEAHARGPANQPFGCRQVAVDGARLVSLAELPFETQQESGVGLRHRHVAMVSDERTEVDAERLETCLPAVIGDGIKQKVCDFLEGQGSVSHARRTEMP